MAKEKPHKNIDLDKLTEEELLKLRVCDLPLTIEGTWLEGCIQQLYADMEAKGLTFNPVCYLAEEWLTPENHIVIGIPFYLAHPALIRLEKKMMMEAEGETVPWCMKLLRHEAGHAVTYAYRLNEKRRWRQIFGSSSQEYPDTYRFRPYSKNYVRHLDGFYAQYHPDEDFVETFAVWLTPNSDWENQYRGWKALGKLQYVDFLMNQIKGKTPFVERSEKHWNYKRMRITLENFYKRKRKLSAEDFPDFHDVNLKKIFTVRDEDTAKSPTAAEFLKKYKKGIMGDVAKWTGEKKYVVNALLKTISKRCRELKLVLPSDESVSLSRLTAYVTMLVMNYRYTGWFRGEQKDKK